MEISFDYKFEPRFSDFDLYGIAHHSRYFYWFEEARFYFMRSIMGMSPDEVSEVRSPLIKVSCEYKKIIKHGDECIIEVKAFFNEEISKIKFEYFLFNKDKTVILAKGTTEHVFLNSEGILLFQLPQNMLTKLKALITKRNDG